MHWNSLPALFSLSVVALAGSACSDDTTGPAAAVPASVTIGSHAQNGEVGKPLSQFLVIVGDGSENVLAGVPVTFGVTAGGGSVDAATVITNNAGAASTTWTLGRTAGADNNSLTVQVAGYQGPPPLITVSAYAGPPVRLTIVSGNLQSGMAGVGLPEPLVVLLRDGSGQPTPGAVVQWTTYDDWGYGRVVSRTSTTNALGHASTTVALDGSSAGTGSVLVRARVQTLGEDLMVEFSASVLAGPAATIVAVSGDLQSARAGTTLPLPIAVQVTDRYGNRKSGVTVDWSASPGSGSTAVASSVTDSNGFASTTWTIGSIVGASNQSATATVAGLTGSPVTFTASATAGP